MLEGAASYVVLHNGGKFSPPQLTSIIVPFGYLDYHPPNAFKFWELIEKQLEEKFIQFPPKEILEIFLACVYLQKFPFNFVDKVFSPYFLDRMHMNETNVK